MLGAALMGPLLSCFGYGAVAFACSLVTAMGALPMVLGASREASAGLVTAPAAYGTVLVIPIVSGGRRHGRRDSRAPRTVHSGADEREVSRTMANPMIRETREAMEREAAGEIRRHTGRLAEEMVALGEATGGTWHAQRMVFSPRAGGGYDATTVEHAEGTIVRAAGEEGVSGAEAW